MTSGQKTGLAFIKDAAEYLGVSCNTVRRLLNDEVLPYKLAGSHRRIPWSAIYEFSESQNPGRSLEMKISKAGKVAISEALDRMEAEIAAIRNALKRVK